MIDSLDVSGGSEKQLIRNLQHFDHKAFQHEVTVIKPGVMTRQSELPGAVPLTHLFREGEHVDRRQIITRLRRFLGEEKPDLVHASLADSALATRIVARLDRVRAVESLVNISHEEVRTVDNPAVTSWKLRLHTLVDRVTMASLSGFHAVSHAVADSWVAVVGLDPRDIRVIPRGVLLEETMHSDQGRPEMRQSVLTEFGLPDETVLILNVGRVEPQKGQRYLIDAFSMLATSHPHMHLLIVGRPGNSSQAVANQINSLGLADRVHLTGARTDVRRFLSASDVFAFPSLFEGNGGNAMLEAMAAGLPILTTASPPMTDLIPDASVGRLAPRCDVSAIASALAALADNPALREQLGNAARKRVETFARPNEVAALHEGWYSELIG